MTVERLLPQSFRHSGKARISVLFLIAACLTVLETTAYSQQSVHFDKGWWESLNGDEHRDFIYGFTDCGKAIQSGLNTAQYEDFISKRVDSSATSVPRLILLAPKQVKLLTKTPGGEVWTDKHGFNDGDLWGDHVREGRTWVEAYLACEHRPAYPFQVDRYVRPLVRHYSNPSRHSDKLTDVLESLLPPKKSVPN